MSMSIHDEAVEAALKATNAAGYKHITALSVVAILEAAAPILREQAWNEGAFSEHDFDGTPTGINPYQCITPQIPADHLIDEME